MILEVRAVAPFYKNGFVAACERTREAVIIDPGDEVDELLGAVRDLDVDVRAVLLTHAHIDHVTGVATAKDAFSVPVYLHRDDLFLYESVVEQGALFGFKVRPQPPIAGRDLFVGDTLFAGSIGRADLPGGDYKVLMRSITEVLFPLGDDAVVHPGHGPDTSIERERKTNPFVLEYLARR